MKIGGVEVTAPSKEFEVFPRDQGDIVIWAQALSDTEEFEGLCPMPNPPGRRTKHGWEPNPEDETYKQQVIRRNEQQIAYIVIKSLEPSDIEWDNVDINNPKTWLGWREELKEAGFTSVEINRIVNLVWAANGLDEEKIKAARESFLAGQQKEADESSSHLSDQESTPSGQPATG